MDKSLPDLPTWISFSCEAQKALPGESHHSPINIPGDDRKMENQNERKEWNERWLDQILEWRQECDRLLDEAAILLALIELAKSQIRRDPPE
jgi:hypothetical protein